jgi:preprotein translocase subunit SecA
MAFSFLKTTSRHERAGRAYEPRSVRISALAPTMQAASDEELKQRVLQYKGKTYEELQPHVEEIFAAVREASERVLKMRHFDVQLMGGLALLDNKISEMKTGEGKTLVATLPLVVRALTGRGAHLVTVNDYLSQRDAAWMSPLYEFFGLSVGVVTAGQSSAEKRAAYAADITYGTNNEFGFDYLRDNMAARPEDMTQRDLHYAIVDEVDSILIDEARTPLIISAPDAESTQLYQQFARLVPQLAEGTHYNVDEKRRAATLTDEGIGKVEEALGIRNIYEEQGVRMVHHLEQALRAYTLYHRDKEYLVRDGQVFIVDEFTGRILPGRRYSEGLHQAIEAKEGVKVQHESRTLATVTFQNFFRLYENLAGMTGTAQTSAEEFEKVYNLDVVIIPTNKPLTRLDKPDSIFVTQASKYAACVAEIKQRHSAGQPVLVGTIAIEKSEHLAALLKREGIPHEVLNAKHHAREAEIIAQAGQRGAVTISTNMAGRGTDIKLGEGVAAVGGLFVLGTERHEARRIDNQLRGRSGRQGDPGETKFFVSLEDDIMRIFGGERLKGLMQRLRLPEDQPIENSIVSKSIEGAQERVEGYYFDSRKQVLAYDDVLNRQREAIYTLRRGVLLRGVWQEVGAEPEAILEHIHGLLEEYAAQLILAHTGESRAEDWNLEEIAESVRSLTGYELATLRDTLAPVVAESVRDGEKVAQAALTNTTTGLLKQRLREREDELSPSVFADLVKAAIIRAIDTHWMEHLDTMDYLRAGIGLRGYGQRDPLIEYQREGFQLFKRLLVTIKGSILDIIFKAQAVAPEQPQGIAQHPAPSLSAASGASNNNATSGKPLSNQYKNISRNDPCPCGSGKKFKKCHGK